MHLKPLMNKIQARIILNRLKRYGYVRDKTADSLGVDVRTLRYYLEKLRNQGYTVPDSPILSHERALQNFNKFYNRNRP